MSRGRTAIPTAGGGSKSKLVVLGIFTGLVVVASTAIYLPFFSSQSRERKEQVQSGHVFGTKHPEILDNKERVPGSVWKNITKVRDSKPE